MKKVIFLFLGMLLCLWNCNPPGTISSPWSPSEPGPSPVPTTTQSPSPSPSPSPISSPPIYEEAKQLASDGEEGDRFGYSLCFSADSQHLVVGSVNDDDIAPNSGSIYLYKWENNKWNQTKVSCQEPTAWDRFGCSVGISGDGQCIVTGAKWQQTNGSKAGAIYIYKQTPGGWEETQILASDGEENDYFGHAVSISDDGLTAVAGAYGDDGFGIFSGSAYVYRYNGLTWEETKLHASDDSNSSQFGRFISISGDGLTIAAGAYGDIDNGIRSGAVYIYQWDGNSWEETKITPSDGEAEDRFGSSVALSTDGRTLAVGAYWDDVNGAYSGSVYIFKWNGVSWNEIKLIPSDGGIQDYFGKSIDLSGDGELLGVGAYGYSEDDDNTGAVYLYQWEQGGWEEIKICPQDRNNENLFGFHLSLAGGGDFFAVGAECDNEQGTESGAVYIYRK